MYDLINDCKNQIIVMMIHPDWLSIDKKYTNLLHKYLGQWKTKIEKWVGKNQSILGGGVDVLYDREE